MFQDYALFPHLTVAGNVGFGLAHARGRAGGAARAKSRTLWRWSGLDGFGAPAHRTNCPAASGSGWRSPARCVVEPAVLLLDEPLGALDLQLRRQVQDELKALQRRVGTTFVHVTHDQEEAMALADLLVVMNAGRIEDAGPAGPRLSPPATRFTATFMGESNLIEGRVTAPGEGWVEVDTRLGRTRASGADGAGGGGRQARADLVGGERPWPVVAWARPWSRGHVPRQLLAGYGPHAVGEPARGAPSTDA